MNSGTAESASVLMSIKPQWGDLIIAGEKTVELRRRPPRRAVDRIYFYFSAPVMALSARCRVDRIVTETVANLIAEYQSAARASASQFSDYYNGMDKGSALLLSDIAIPSSPMTLSELRDIDPAFRPPQNFRYIAPGWSTSLDGRFTPMPAPSRSHPS